MLIFYLILEILPFFIIPTIIITVIMSRTKRSSKKSNQDKGFQNTISNANDPNSYANTVSQENLDTYCAYCGSKFSKTKKSCPACGAKTDDVK